MVEEWAVKGTDKKYMVTQKNGVFSCSCLNWKLLKDDCKHIKTIKRKSKRIKIAS